jgi:hypothetical protein
MRVVPPGTRAQRVALETREKLYPVRKQVNRDVMRNGKIVKVVRGDKQVPVGLDDPGGRGEEIVREALACPACAAAAVAPGSCPEEPIPTRSIGPAA